VDDVLIMTKASLREWKTIDSLLSTFCRASGLCVNPFKSTFHYSSLIEDDLLTLSALFSLQFCRVSGTWDFISNLQII
jgi:hypothetical protein